MKAALIVAVFAVVLGTTTAAEASHRDPPPGYFYTCPDQAEPPNGGARVATTQCHTVKRDEWLWKIARTLPSSELDRHYDGEPSNRQLHQRVDELYRWNRAAIGPDPNRIRPGMVLIVGQRSI